MQRGGLLFVVVHGLLIAVAFLVAEHGLWAHGLSSCGTQALERRLSSCARAYLLRGMWDLPRPGLEPVSRALAGGFLTTAPPGKSHRLHFLVFFYVSVSYVPDSALSAGYSKTKTLLCSHSKSGES